ncbi:MAG TPA: hypothetical protein VH300_00945 [Thermoleophilaceae bacterium]|nr:hypothetical protein [Thermoleophilaceae bacterium]
MIWDPVSPSGALDSAPHLEESPFLMDDFLESYLSWREEAANARGAYADWRAAPERDAPWAFAEYRWALDREEHAARLLRESSERLATATAKKAHERTSC